MPSLLLAQKALVPSVLGGAAGRARPPGEEDHVRTTGKMRLDTCEIQLRTSQWPSTLVPWLQALPLQFKFRLNERKLAVARASAVEMTEGFWKTSANSQHGDSADRECGQACYKCKFISSSQQPCEKA